MSYKILLPQKMMKNLWLLREYCGEPSIIEQVRVALSEYLTKKEQEIGTTIEDVSEQIEKYDQKKAKWQELKELEESEKSTFPCE